MVRMDECRSQEVVADEGWLEGKALLRSRETGDIACLLLHGLIWW